MLAKGCACCSIADELLTSIETLTDGGKRDLDGIVVELSGVADPAAVSTNWQMARAGGHPATSIADLRRTVTLIDACTFGTDWMSRDVAGDREGWTELSEGTDPCTQERKVPELLVEQVESADLILVNKVDMSGEDQAGVAGDVARGLNGRARIMQTEFGRIGAADLLGDLLDGKSEEQDQQSSIDGRAKDRAQSHRSHKQSLDRLGITSFVYKKDRPFSSQRLLAFLSSWPVPIKDDLDFGDPALLNAHPVPERNVFAGVLRSKGFIWMAPAM